MCLGQLLLRRHWDSASGGPRPLCVGLATIRCLQRQQRERERGGNGARQRRSSVPHAEMKCVHECNMLPGWRQFAIKKKQASNNSTEACMTGKYPSTIDYSMENLFENHQISLRRDFLSIIYIYQYHLLK